jgi:hypothetical protein
LIGGRAAQGLFAALRLSRRTQPWHVQAHALKPLHRPTHTSPSTHRAGMIAPKG